MLPLLIGIVVLSTAAMTLLYASMRRALLSEFDDSLRAKATGLGSLVTLQPSGKLEFDYSDENYAEFRRGKRPEFFQIRLSDGTTLERSETLKRRDLLDARTVPADPHPLTLPDGRAGRAMTAMLSATRDLDDPVAAANAQPMPVPTVFVTVARETASLDQSLSRLRTYLILTVLLLTAGVALLVPAVVRRGLRPLDAIADHAGRLDAGSLDRRFPADHVPLELAPITARLNDLLGRLSEAFGRESRFTASAAHELRTPISEIRAVAEVAIQWPEMAQSQRALGDVVEVTKRMETLIDALMRLARSRAGKTIAQPEAIDLGGVVGQVLRSLDGTASARQIKVQIADESRPAAWCDPMIARAIVTNLIGNALLHAPPRSQVLIRIESADEGVRVEIINDCEGLRREDLPRLCEPFWTNSSSRSDGRHGLGLALVAEYAKVAGARFRLDVCEDRTFHAVVDFPAGSSPHAVGQDGAPRREAGQFATPHPEIVTIGADTRP
jgi:signal transduction histidine kinase